jgi:hypothetical protein
MGGMMAKKKIVKKNIFAHNYLVNLYYGETMTQYFFKMMTKRQILARIMSGPLLGEACDGLTFKQVGDDDVIFLGGLKVEG